jgi:phosphate transport system protein
MGKQSWCLSWRTIIHGSCFARKYAFLKRDSELCDHVVAEDEEIDILEKQVDQGGISLLIRFQPVASDMRKVLSAMKISANLERIADQSVSIARRAKHLK